MARVKFSGLDKLNRKLFRLPREAEKAIRVAMEKGADEIVALAKSLAPVGASTGVKASKNPGALRDSIGWTWGDAPRGSISLGNVTNGEGGDLKITIFAGNDEAFYARWVEFGTEPHTITSKTPMARAGQVFGTEVSHPGNKQSPFFFPAYSALKRRVKNRITRAVNSSAKKVANGA